MFMIRRKEIRETAYRPEPDLKIFRKTGIARGANRERINSVRLRNAVAGYVNCPKGTKVVANYVTDSKSITGKFEAEEFED